MKLRQLGEFGLLDALEVNKIDLPSSWVGPGDDAALFPSPDGDQVVTTDLLAEDVHFRRQTISPENLGYKALAVNVSDLAAMGARPLAFTIAAALPGDLDVAWIKALYRGMTEGAARFGCPLVGGDTCSADRIFLSITAFGMATTGAAVLRSTAQPGQDLYVSGTLGDSAAGFRLLEEQQERLDPDGLFLVSRHHRPEPRLALGSELARQSLATAMIDLSDGLCQDAGHIARTSQVAVEIQTDQLPLSDALTRLGQERGWNPLALALGGGEDYELLFAAPREAREGVAAIAQQLKTPVTRIGQTAQGEAGVRLLDKQGIQIPAPGSEGFDHFRNRKK